MCPIRIPSLRDILRFRRGRRLIAEVRTEFRRRPQVDFSAEQPAQLDFVYDMPRLWHSRAPAAILRIVQYKMSLKPEAVSNGR
jgi:hypothetical protein